MVAPRLIIDHHEQRRSEGRESRLDPHANEEQARFLAVKVQERRVARASQLQRDLHTEFHMTIDEAVNLRSLHREFLSSFSDKMQTFNSKLSNDVTASSEYDSTSSDQVSIDQILDSLKAVSENAHNTMHALRLAYASSILAEYRTYDYQRVWYNAMVRQHKLANATDDILYELATNIHKQETSLIASQLLSQPINSIDQVCRHMPAWKNVTAKANAAIERYHDAKKLYQLLHTTEKLTVNDELRDWASRAHEALNAFCIQSSDHPKLLEDVATLLSAHMQDPSHTLKSFATNFVLMGAPGAGKTSICRSLGHILQCAGILVGNGAVSPIDDSSAQASSTMAQVTRTDLVGEFLGESAIKVQNVISSAYGKMLFVCDADRLVEGPGDQHGKDALNELVLRMPLNQGRVSFVFAGYEDAINCLLGSNEGLRRCFECKCILAPLRSERMAEIFISALQPTEERSQVSFDVKNTHDIQHRIKVFLDWCRSPEAMGALVEEDISELFESQKHAMERIARIAVSISARAYLLRHANGAHGPVTADRRKTVVAKAIWQYAEPLLHTTEAKSLLLDKLRDTFGESRSENIATLRPKMKLHQVETAIARLKLA